LWCFWWVGVVVVCGRCCDEEVKERLDEVTFQPSYT
jgi:hypothetical protein